MSCGLYVTHKQQQAWIWLALDYQTREVVGIAVGDRSQSSAQRLWHSLPGVYRQCAVCYTDFWQAYGCVLPRKRHRAVGKASGHTNSLNLRNWYKYCSCKLTKYESVEVQSSGVSELL